MKIGIWCDFGFTLRPSEGIGVFVAQLLRGLALQPHPPRVTLVFNGNDRAVHHELLAYAQGLDVDIVVPPAGILQSLRLLYQRTLSHWLKRASGQLIRLERWIQPMLPRVVAAALLSYLGESGAPRLLKRLALLFVSPVVLIDVLLALTYATAKHLAHLGPLWARVSWKALRSSLFGGEYASIFRSARQAACDVWLLPYPGLPVAPDLRTPLVLVIHDLVYRHHPEGFEPMQSAELFALTESLAHRATVTACLSEAVRENELCQELQLPRTATAVIPHAVPADIALQDSTDPADLRQRLGLPEHFFFYPSAFRPYKNHALAVRALALLVNERNLDVGMVFTGVQGVPARLHSLLAEAGMRERVFVLGRVSRADVAGLYRAALALAFPSLHEGFGFPPLEALALGCPVVCSDIPVLREVVGGYGDAVRLVNPYSASAWASALAAMRDARVHSSEALAAARESVLGRTWEQVAKQWLRVCERAARIEQLTDGA